MQAGNAAFWMAGLLMALFTADVAAGAFFRAAFLPDLIQALALAISCSFFVAGILLLEGRKKRGSTTLHREEETR